MSGGALVYALTTLDLSGRLGDRSLLRTMDWPPGTRLGLHEEHGLILVTADRHGVFRVTGQGYLILPAAARHWCGLRGGDQVLLVADPGAGWLVALRPASPGD